MRMDLYRLHEILQTESGRAHFRSHYPDEMSWYESAVRSGFSDSMVQAVLMTLWQQEMERNAGPFCERLEAGA